MKKPSQPMTLRFLFLGYKRPWSVLDGHPSPEGDVWEVRSLPSGLSSWGSTFHEAVKRLQRTVDAALESAEARSIQPAKWYQDAIGRMDDDDRREFERGWANVAMKGLPSFKASSPDYEYAPVSEELECV